MGTSAFWKRLWRDALPSPAAIEQVTEDSSPIPEESQPAEPVRKVFVEKAKSSPVRPRIETQTQQNSLSFLKGEKQAAGLFLLLLPEEAAEEAMEATHLSEIEGLADMIPALRDLKEALQSGDKGKVEQAATEFSRRASLLESEEAHEKYLETRKDPNWQTIKEVLIPARVYAESLMVLEFGD